MIKTSIFKLEIFLFAIETHVLAVKIFLDKTWFLQKVFNLANMCVCRHRLKVFKIMYKFIRNNNFQLFAYFMEGAEQELYTYYLI